MFINKLLSFFIFLTLSLSNLPVFAMRGAIERQMYEYQTEQGLKTAQSNTNTNQDSIEAEVLPFDSDISSYNSNLCKVKKELGNVTWDVFLYKVANFLTREELKKLRLVSSTFRDALEEKYNIEDFITTNSSSYSINEDAIKKLVKDIKTKFENGDRAFRFLCIEDKQTLFEKIKKGIETLIPLSLHVGMDGNKMRAFLFHDNNNLLRLVGSDKKEIKDFLFKKFNFNHDENLSKLNDLFEKCLTRTDIKLNHSLNAIIKRSSDASGFFLAGKIGFLKKTVITQLINFPNYSILEFIIDFMFYYTSPNSVPELSTVILNTIIIPLVDLRYFLIWLTNKMRDQTINESTIKSRKNDIDTIRFLYYAINFTNNLFYENLTQEKTKLKKIIC